MKIFLSYSSKDLPLAKKIGGVFERYNIDYWAQFKQTISKEFVTNKVTDALYESTHFLLLWTKNSKKSHSVNEEVSVALELKDKLSKIIVVLDNVKPDVDLSNLVYYRATKNNLDKIISNIVDHLKLTFPKQMNLFKKKVLMDYQSFPEEYSDKLYEPIIRNFRQFNGYQNYIPQSYLNLQNMEEGEDIVQKIFELIKLNIRFIPIVGDYGSGKSQLCHFLLYNLCKENSEWNDNETIPIFIPLINLNYNKTDNFEDLIYQFVIKEYDFKVSKEEFDEQMKVGNMFFILDGLDEMFSTLDDSITSKIIDSLEKISKNNVVVVTSRYTFISENTERTLLKNHNVLKIKEFNDSQVNGFIHKKIGKNYQQLEKIKNAIHQVNLKDVIRKPLLLNVICDKYDSLKNYFVINDAIIFKILTEEWIKHDVLKRSELSDDEKNKLINMRQRISEILALLENRKEQPIGMNDLRKELKNELRYESVDEINRLEEYFKDAIYSTFLIQENKNSFRFIIKPVREYLVARRIVNNINVANSELVIRESNEINSSEIFNFIKNITDIEWAVKPHVLQEIQKHDPAYEILETRLNNSTNLLSMINDVRQRKTKPRVGNLVRILHITGNLPRTLDYSLLNLSHIDLRNADLTGCDFSYADLTGADLSFSILRYCTMVGTDLSKSDLNHADLTGADLSKSDLSYADFTGANLSKILLNNAKITNTILVETKLSGAVLNGVDVKGADLSYADLTGADLRGSIFYKIYLNNADLRESDLKNSSLLSVDLRKSNLTNINFSNSKIKKCDFMGANLTNANFSESHLEDVKLQNTSLKNTIFEKATLKQIQIDKESFKDLSNVAQQYILQQDPDFNNIFNFGE